MEKIDESLTPQEKIAKFNADVTKKNMRLRDLGKRLQFATKSGKRERVEIIKLDIQLTKMDIQRLRMKIKKEQLKIGA